MRYDENEDKVTIMSRPTGDKYIELESKEYNAAKIGSDILVGKPRNDEEQLENIVCDIKNQLQQIIYGFIYNLSLSKSDSKRRQEISFYCRVLSQDKKFMAAAEDVYKHRHKGFEKGYRMLNNISDD